jgi:hypothetical protein
MAGNMVFMVCSCGMAILIPAEATSFYCWNCHRQWPRNPRAGRPVQYGKNRPPRVYRKWPERITHNPNIRPQPAHFAPPTGRTIVQPADFHMNEAPVGPILGESASAPVAAAATAKAGSTAGTVFWMIFSLVMIGVAVSIALNPQGFVDKVADLLGSSGSSSSSSISLGNSCTKVNQAFSYIGDCSRSNGYSTKSGYSYCYVETRSNSGCQTSGGVTLCDSGTGQAWIPNACIP